MKTSISIDKLKELLNYNPETGVFSWRNSGRGRRPQRAGTSESSGYERITICGEKHYSHRLAWFVVTGEWAIEIDHVDGDGMNNKISNLRKATRVQNMRNRGIAKNSKSGITGVSFNNEKKMWCSYIQLNGKTRHLGFFKEKSHAATARRAAEKESFGAFCR